MSKDFFSFSITFTDGIQNLIKKIIELEDIEHFLENEIINLEKIFIDMVNDPS